MVDDVNVPYEIFPWYILQYPYAIAHSRLEHLLHMVARMQTCLLLIQMSLPLHTSLSLSLSLPSMQQLDSTPRNHTTPPKAQHLSSPNPSSLISA